MLGRCPKCKAPNGARGARWVNVLKDIETLGMALSEACETLEQTIPGWERSRQWYRLSKALGRADFWRSQIEEVT